MRLSTAPCRPLPEHAIASLQGALAGTARPGATLTDPIDRALMTSDGTVTTMLEAFTGEPIVTVLARQSGPAGLAVLEREIGCWWQPSTELLELAPAERLIARRVLLRGRHSGAAFVAAESLVVADRLPDPTALDIDRVGTSLGRLLNASGLSTRRRIVETIEARDRGCQRPPRRDPNRPSRPPYLHDRQHRADPGRRDRMDRSGTPRRPHRQLVRRRGARDGPHRSTLLGQAHVRGGPLTQPVRIT